MTLWLWQQCSNIYKRMNQLTNQTTDQQPNKFASSSNSILYYNYMELKKTQSHTEQSVS